MGKTGANPGSRFLCRACTYSQRNNPIAAALNTTA